MSRQETNVLWELVSAMHDNERRLDDTSSEVCEQREIGKLIEVLGYDFLLETLALEQRVFAAEYPTMTSVGEETRRSIKETLNNHFEQCRYCQMEAKKDRAWRKEFAHFLRTEKEVVTKILKEKRSTPRRKLRSFKATSR
ncbi:MAG: hypothetical protein DMF72_15235 [Acidobacteria bacterium]|nr:MAG: hypothetical protein DMF72_15235 [Acidobacteriota bacterium]